jgi:Uma2 family endonuclease
MATTLLEKQEIKKQDVGQTKPSGEAAPHHWTVEEFYRAYDIGELDDLKRWELIQGRIVEKMPPGFYHASLSDIIAQMLREAMEPLFIVREEKPIHLSSDSELVPDITVVRGVRTDYLDHHPVPEEIVAIVEVADNSSAKDLGEKAQSYARAGVADYWVVLANEAAIIRHRQPAAEGYAEVTRLAGAETLSPLAAPEALWTITTLLGREEARKEN